MTAVIKAGDQEIEAGFVYQDGAFRASVLIRTDSVKGEVRSVGYVFVRPYSTQQDAIESAVFLAKRMSVLADR